MGNDEWFILGENGEPLGPFTLERVQRSYQAGTIPPGTMVSQPGSSQWFDIYEVLGPPPKPQGVAALPPVPGRSIGTRVGAHAANSNPLANEPDAPSRSMPLAIAMVAVPTFMLVVHVSFLHVFVPWLLATLICGLAACAVAGTDPLRSMTPMQLLRLVTKSPAARYGWVGLFGVVELATLVLGVSRWLSVRRIEEAINDKANPCACEKYTEKQAEEYDLGFQWATARSRCTAQREAVAASEAKRVAADRAAKFKAACLQAVPVVAQGGTIPPGVFDGFAEEGASVKRMAERTLLPTDLSVTPKSVTCGAAMWPSFVKAVANSMSALPIVAPDTVISSDLVTALHRAGGSSGEPISDRVSQFFSTRVDQTAMASVAQAKQAEDLGGPVRLCEIAKTWGFEVTAACSSVLAKQVSLAKSAKAKTEREEAAAKAKEARCEAAEKQSQACYRMCDNQGPRDELGFPEFNPESRCYTGCDRAKEAGCR